MKVLLTGATGLVGQKLSTEILSQGHELVVLGRSPEEKFRQRFSLPCQYFQWTRPESELPPKQALEGLGAVIHLAGESIAEGRWSEEKKQRIYDSRIKSSENLLAGLQETKIPPVILSTSAIGFYGDRGDEELTEESAAGEGFLAQVCIDWEKAWESVQEKTRLCFLRVGVVLSPRGGFLSAMDPIFSSGGGGDIGSGKQWVSWIHENDLVALFMEALKNEKFRGAVNAVAPAPVTNSQLTKELARVHQMPAFLPVPEIAVRLLKGEMAVLATASQKVLAQRAEQWGFQFEFGELAEALSDIYSWKKSRHDRLFYVEQWVPKKPDEVFPFFSQETNLEEITPPFLGFRVVGKSTEEIEDGTLIDYRLKIHGFPAKWRSRIEKWQPNKGFQDVQIKGPYAKWEHYHGFRELAGGTLMTDHVVYRLPLGDLSKGIVSSFVAGDVQKIFNYRWQQVESRFGSAAPAN